MRLVRPGTWTTAWRYDLMPAESAMCVRSLALNNPQTGSPQSLLAVGTSQSFGEVGHLVFISNMI